LPLVATRRLAVADAAVALPARLLPALLAAAVELLLRLALVAPTSLDLNPDHRI